MTMEFNPDLNKRLEAISKNIESMTGKGILMDEGRVYTDHESSCLLYVYNSSDGQQVTLSGDSLEDIVENLLFLSSL